MSVPTDTRRSERRRGGKKRWLLIPAIAVILLAAALVWLNSVYVYAGGFHRRDSAQIDLRGKSISEQKYLRLSEQLPNCEIFWDVPIGGGTFGCESETVALTAFSEEDIARLAYFPALTALDLTAADVTPALFDAVHTAYPALSVRWSIPIGEGRYPSDAESIALTDFTVSELPLFDYFTALRAADARECTCYDAILALREKYPALELQWQVPLGGTEYLADAAEIAVDDAATTPETLAAALRYLPAAKSVSFPACPWSETEKDALRAEFPDIAFVWPVEFFGTIYQSDTAELSFASRALSETELSELSEKLISLPKLTRVDLTDTGVTLEQMTPVCEKYPAVDFVFSFELFGVPISTEDTLLDFTGIAMESTEAVESILPVMHRLEKVDMSDCGFSDEEMDALNKKYENVRFVWTLHITHYDIRTDTTYFRASSRYYGYFTNESVKRLAYCPDMIALDLGHRPIEDLNFLYEMPKLKYLVLLDCHALDLSPIASCDELIWLELNRAYTTSIAPLKDCKGLRDLNITCMTLLQPEDTFATLMEMDQLERVWFSYGVLTGAEQQQLQEAHPDIVYHGVEGWLQSNEDPWRYDQDYYDMRDALGHMFYMNGTGIITYKMIDGVRYELDPEFIATMDWGEHDKDR